MTNAATPEADHGVLIVALIVYVIVGFGYALLTADQHGIPCDYDYDDAYCPRPALLDLLSVV